MPDYPKIEAPFIGHVHESFKQSDLDSTHLEVEKRHVGYYEQLPSKVVETPTTKITDLPKIETQFIENVPETSKRYDIHPVPFEVENNYIGYYEHLPLKIQEEKKPGALEKLTNLFKGSKKEGEFPTDSEPYFGPLKETKVVSEATGEPIHSLVSVYSSGRSDEVPTARIPIESVEEPSAHYLFETERNSDLPEYQLNNLVNVYSSGHSDEITTTKITEFPINEAPFVGNVHEIKRNECQASPLEFEMKNVGYYEHLPSVTTEEGKKPGLLDKITHLFKEGVTIGDYPQVTAPFSGHIFETNHPTELYAFQIEQHVNVYSSGRSDEIPKATEYPIETSYVGHVSESKRSPEINSVPLEIENKHIGYYERLPTPAEHSEKKLGTLEKLTQFLKGSKTTEEYLVDSEPYTGTVQRIEATSEAPNEPIHAFVSVYSSGRSDEVPSIKTTEFPINEAPFIGNVHKIKRQECETSPLGFEVKHVGYYEKLPSTSTKTSEYPQTEDPFTEHIHSLQRNEVENLPLEVENNYIGYYEHLPSSTAVIEEKKPGALEKLTSLFKGSKTEDFPVDAEPYSGPITLTNTITDLTTEPIHSLVSIYSSGRSDDEEQTKKHSEFPINEAPYVDYVPESKLHSGIEHIPLDLEKKYIGYYEQMPSTSIKTTEYPQFEEPFIGHIHSCQLNEVETVPIEVENKHMGYYEHLLPTNDEEKKSGALEKLSRLFKGSKTDGDYPSDSEPYIGQISTTNILPELPETSLHSVANIYSSGRSDEIPSKQLPEHPKFEDIFIGNIFETKQFSELQTEPLDIQNKHVGYYEKLPITSIKDEEQEKKTGALEKLSLLFKGEESRDNYPQITEPYSGQIASTSIMKEAPLEPIHPFVSIYSSGRSDEIPTKMPEYPKIEVPFIGYVHESFKWSDFHSIPLKVERRHVGYYEQLPTQKVELSERSTETSTTKIEEQFIGHVPKTMKHCDIHPAPFEVENKYIGYYEHLPSSTTIKEEKKPGALEKLTKFFKGGKTEGDFPVDSEPYSGPIALTNTVHDLTTEPIHSMVSIYSSGRSDEEQAKKHSEFPVNEAPFVDFVPESKLQSEMEHMPLDLEKKHVGYYEHLPITTEYPKMEQPFIGHIHEKKLQPELGALPLDIEKKHEGYYEHLPVATKEEEVKKPGLFDKITHLFKEDVTNSDYPQVTAPFSGHVFKINRPTELRKSQIEQHVNVYSSGRSDEHSTTKLMEYPMDKAPFNGTIFDTNKHSELNILPLEVEKRHIGYYEHLPPLKSEEEKEQKPGALEKITQLFRGSKATDEFPFDSEPYTGKLTSTGIVHELETEPIHSIVSIYSSGDSDEVPTIKMPEFPINEAPFVGYVPESRLHSGMEHIPLDLEGKHVGYYEHLPPTSTKTTEYPKVEQPFIGHIHSCQLNEVESVPMEVENNYIGYYENLPSSTAVIEEKKPGALEKLTKLFKGSKTEGEFPVHSEPYLGPITLTNAVTDITIEPIHSLVSIYSSGRSDEVPTAKITEFPINEASFTGYLHETIPQGELHPSMLIKSVEEPSAPYLFETERNTELAGYQLNSLVTVYSSGRSDEFKATRITEFPINEEPYFGIINESKRLSEFNTMPLEIERKHVGYYESLPSISTHEEEKKPGALEKLAHFFKGSTKEVEDFPIDKEAYTGHVSMTGRTNEATNVPIHPFVNIYSSGRSDEAPTTKVIEFPVNEPPFTGNVFESNRRLEFIPIPLEVEKLHLGYYDHLPSTIKNEEKKPGALKKLTHLFKRSKTEGDYPVDTEPYTGPLASLNIISEAREEPIHLLVSVYSSGHSDEEQIKKHSEFPINEAPFVDYVPESKLHSGMEHIPLDLEKKYIGYYEQLPSTSTKTSEYPQLEQPFIGHVHEDRLKSELDTLPLVVEKKHIGYYEHLPTTKTSEYPKHEEPFIGYIHSLEQKEVTSVPLEVEHKHMGYYEHLPSTKDEEKKPGALEKLTNLFKGSKTEGEFPVDREPYLGPIAKFEVFPEATVEPIHSIVSVYSSGKSDEIPPTEYPKMEAPFIGFIHNSKPQCELNQTPLDIETKHIGFYEHLQQSSHDEEKKPGILEKMTKLLKVSKNEGEFPFDSEPYVGPISNTNTVSQLSEEPIHSLVNIYSSGHYNEQQKLDNIYEAKIKDELINIPLEVETKHVGYYENLEQPPTIIKEKIKIGEPLFQTVRTSEMKESMLDNYVNVYSSGYSDEIHPTKIKKDYPQIEAPFKENVSESKRQLEMDSLPLELEKKHLGYYDHLPKTEETKLGSLDKLTQIFKSGKSIEGFPSISERYTGPVNNTNLYEAKYEPITSFVNVYSSGFSDKQPILTTKLLDYPVNEAPYLGHVFETKQQTELNSSPLEVGNKYIGFYEHLPLTTTKVEEEKKPGTLEKLKHIFIDSKAEQFPFDPEPFSGPITNTKISSEVKMEPINSFVNVYSSGRSDEIPASTTIPEYPKIVSSPFLGTVYEAKRRGELTDAPLKVENKHIGYYEHLPFSTTSKEEKKPGAIEKLTKLFKGSKTEGEFPVDSEPFDGYIANTNVVSEAQAEPIYSLVSVYSSGRSDETPTTKTLEYPKTEALFVGHILETKHSNLHHVPYEIEKKHIGYYEQLPSTSSKASEYPKLEQPFTGHIHSMRRNEVEDLPLEVENRHIGFYEHLPLTNQEEKKPGALEKLTNLFKGSKTESEFPVDSEPYSGPITLTNTDTDLTTEPIHSMVSIYSSGRSDEMPTTRIPVEYPRIEAPFTGYVHESFTQSDCHSIPLEVERRYVGYYEHLPTRKIDSFERSAKTPTTEISDFPKIEAKFIGHVPETMKHYDIHPVPFEVENKYIGYYEHLPLTNQEEKKSGALEKLTKLFKGSKSEGEFPVDSEPYSGPVILTNTATNLTAEPIHSLVSVYSSGRSDEIQKTKTTEFPINEAPFVGYVQESKLQSGIEHIPLDLEKKYIGYYEQLPSTTTKETFIGYIHENKLQPELVVLPFVVEKKHIGHYEQLPSSSSKRPEYPQLEQPFIGHIYSLKLNEVKSVPMGVEHKHIGYYEHLPSKHEEEKKPGTLEKLTKLIKGGKTQEGFPVDSEPYYGSVSEFNKFSEIITEPIHSSVNLYSPGHYELLPIKIIQTSPDTQEMKSVPLDDNFVKIKEINGIFDKKSLRSEEGFLRGSVETIVPAHLKEEIKIEEKPILEEKEFLVLGLNKNEIKNVLMEDFVEVYNNGYSFIEEEEKEDIPLKKEIIDVKTEEKLIKNVQDKSFELDYIPIEKSVSLYHHGWYGGRLAEFEDEKDVIDQRQLLPHMNGTLSDIKQKRDVIGSIDKTLTKPKENQTVEPVELHVRISELKKPGITEDNEKKKLKQLSFPTTFPVKETKFEERTLGEDQLQSIYAKAASFRDERLPVAATQRMRRPMVMKSEDLSIDSKPKPLPRTQYTSQYSDQLYKYSSPGSIRRPVGASPRGWTSVTEATTITFAKRHSFDRTTEEGKVQHVVEDIIVYRHGGGGSAGPVRRMLPPGLPKAPATKKNILPSSYLDERYHNISQRYNYYRSRSQDQEQRGQRKHDKWLQTDPEELMELNNVPFEHTHTSRSVGRTTTTEKRSHHLRTYRSYSSHLYDRHAYARDYSSPRRSCDASPETFAYRTERSTHSLGRLNDDFPIQSGFPRATTAPIATQTPPLQQRRTFMNYESSINRQQVPDQSPRMQKQLIAQRSNIEETPLSVYSQNGVEETRTTIQHSKTLPLETRILPPGIHTPPPPLPHFSTVNGGSHEIDEIKQEKQEGSRRTSRASLRQARQRIRNYCGVL
ncbi:unnamed protein product [Meloidogyne enterolobii]|uniref:Uncharacterized protein n=1 Tax=Meloidogyne enterolobii TaxID=390850 RepID=A0ACB1B4J4_MELEN